MSIKRRSGARGQALTEGILLIPVLVIVVFSILWFLRVLITQQQLVMAARYGTDMIFSTRLNENDIRREVRNYLSHHWIAGRRLDARKLRDENIEVRIRDFTLPDLSPENPRAFFDLYNGIHGLLDPLKDTSCVTISYEIDTPRLIAFLTRGRSFRLTAHSEVLSGTGCNGAHHRRERSART